MTCQVSRIVALPAGTQKIRVIGAPAWVRIGLPSSQMTHGHISQRAWLTPLAKSQRPSMRWPPSTGRARPIGRIEPASPHIGGASRHLPADLGFEQAGGVRDAGGNHRAPADGAVGPGDVLDGAKDDERWQLGAAHRARQVHLQEAGGGQRLDKGCWHTAQSFAFLMCRANLRDQVADRGNDVGFRSFR